ncbi:MAG: hypothetical protein AABZ53_01245 [Planctomycetota bacterium]
MSAGACWTTIGQSEAYELGKLVKLRDAIDQFDAEAKLLREPLAIDGKFNKAMPGTLDEYNTLAQAHSAGLKSLTDGKTSRHAVLASLYTSYSGSLDKIGSQEALLSDVMKGLKDRFDDVARAIPAEPREKEAAKLNTLATKIKEATDATSDGLKKAASTMSTDFAAAGRKALVERSGAGEPGFETVVKAHRALDVVLVKGDAVKWLDVGAEAAKVKSATTAASGEVTKLKDASKQALKDSAVFPAIDRGVAIARGGRLSSAIDGLFKELEAQATRKEDLATAINRESKDEANLPVIPLTRLSAEGKKADFAPLGTGRLLGAWKVVSDETVDDARADLIVGGRALKAGKLRHDGAVRLYASKYQDYWYSKIYLKDARVRDDYKDWAEASREYSESRTALAPTKINQQLKDLCDQVAADLALIDDILGTKSYADIVADIRKQSAAYTEGMGKGEKDIGNLKSEVSSLFEKQPAAGQSAVSAARARVREICESDQTAVDHLNATSGKDSAMYWRDLPLRMLGALEKSVRDEADGHARALIDLAKFPLLRDPSRGALSLQEFAAVEAALAGLPEGGPNDGPRLARLNDLEKEIRIVATKILSPDRQRLDAVLDLKNVGNLRKMLAAFKAAGTKGMIESIEFIPGEPSGTQPARVIAEFVRVDLAGSRKDLLLSDEAFNADATKFDPSQEQPLELTLVKNGAAIAPAVQFPVPWSAARLLALPNVTKDDKGYTVPVVFTGADGKRYGFNLRLKLRQSIQMPDLADWPASIGARP